ncbi:MAG: hypothetical protein AAB614_01925 [Patescibacteria group bacterium]
MKIIKFILIFGAFASLFFIFYDNYGSSERISSFGQSESIMLPVTLLSFYDFSYDEILYEAGASDDSSSPYWWLNSGGLLSISGGVGMTNQGDLSIFSKFYKLYEQDELSNIDTDGGLHPQNIFRIITRLELDGNIRQEVYANIIADNLSISARRNESNGILLFNRYKDGNNLYYAGVRVDGTAVIKKKVDGIYYTMAQKSIFAGKYSKYHRDTNPNLLPKNKWIGVRVDTLTNADKTVTVKLFLDEGKTGNWKEVLSAMDNGSTYGGSAIQSPGYGGFRTDFMDLFFDDYRIIKL